MHVLKNRRAKMCTRREEARADEISIRAEEDQFRLCNKLSLDPVSDLGEAENRAMQDYCFPSIARTL